MWKQSFINAWKHLPLPLPLLLLLLLVLTGMTSALSSSHPHLICDRIVNYFQNKPSLALDPLRFMEYVKERSSHWEGTVILITADYPYRRLFLNWFSQIRKLELESSVVVITDGPEMSSLLSAHKIRHFPAGNFSTPGYLGKFRVKVVTLALCTESNVIFSDSDAVWLQNSIGFFQSSRWDLAMGSDLVATRSLEALKAAWEIPVMGSFGFSFWRYSPNMMGFVSFLNSLGFLKSDEGWATNMAVDLSGVFNGWTLQAGTYTTRTRSPNIRFAILSLDIVSKDGGNLLPPSAIALHSQRWGDPRSKEFLFKNREKVWFLPEDALTGIQNGQLVTEQLDFTDLALRFRKLL